MTEKQQQLLFDKGITNVPSDVLCSDNALSESVGMIYDHGEHRVIQRPALLMNRSDEILFVHSYNNGKRYIYLDSGVIWWEIEPGIPRGILMASTNPKITSIGKTLIISDDGGLHYFLWNSDTSYKPLSLQLPDLEFEALVYDIQTASFGSHVYNSKPAEGILGTIEEGGVQRLDVLEGQQESYNDLVAGLYAKNKKAVAAEKGFVEPFFVRAAIEMYDGSYTHITNPILLFPAVTKNSYARTYNKNLVLFTHYAKLAVKQTFDYSDYSDIVKDVVVFVSDGVHIYNTNIDQDFQLMTPEEKAACADSVLSDEVGVPCSVFTDFSAVDTSLPAFDCLRQRTEKDIMGDLKEVSVFYKLCSLGIKGTGGYIEVSTLINDKVLDNLTTQEHLEYDDYYSRCNLIAKSIYSYNNRINIANVNRGTFEGFQYFMPLDWSTNDKTYDFFVTIETDIDEIVVHHQNLWGGQQKQGIYFYYPDSRAKHVQIYRYDSAQPHYVCVLDEDLEKHQGLNGAFFLRELPSSDSVDEIEVFRTNVLPDYDNNYRENLANYLITSEVNNPYVFLAEGYNAIGSGRIIGVSSTTQALSQGQFGQYPLLVFSTDGIWAMSVSNTGLYSSIHPMSREVALENNPAITQTDGEVFFVSKKGLMVVAGNQVRCVSEQLSGKSIGTDFTIADMGDFCDYISNSMIAYDYRDSLLWICRQSGRYCYVYSIKSGTFGKYDFGTFELNGNQYPIVAKAVVSDYPDNLICTNMSILSLLRRTDINNDVNAYNGTIITRPMKLENVLALKSLMKIVNVRDMKGDVKLKVFASNNITDWVQLTSLRGIPWIYYRFRFDFSQMNATDRFAGSVIVTQTRRQNKIRTYLMDYKSDEPTTEYTYSIVTNYDGTGEMVIPKNQDSQAFTINAEFFRTEQDNEQVSPAVVNWKIWRLDRTHLSYVPLFSGVGSSVSTGSFTLTEETAKIVICIAKDEEPTIESNLAKKQLTVTKIEDDPADYSYYIGTNISKIVIPDGENTVMQMVRGSAYRTPAGGQREEFYCHIMIWRKNNDTYTPISTDTDVVQSKGVEDEFTTSDTSAVITISETAISTTWTGNYLATVEIPVTQGREPSPEPTPTPTPTTGSITLRINNNSGQTVALSGKMILCIKNLATSADAWGSSNQLDIPFEVPTAQGGWPHFWSNPRVIADGQTETIVISTFTQYFGTDIDGQLRTETHNIGEWFGKFFVASDSPQNIAARANHQLGGTPAVMLGVAEKKSTETSVSNSSNLVYASPIAGANNPVEIVDGGEYDINIVDVVTYYLSGADTYDVALVQGGDNLYIRTLRT